MRSVVKDVRKERGSKKVKEVCKEGCNKKMQVLAEMSMKEV